MEEKRVSRTERAAFTHAVESYRSGNNKEDERIEEYRRRLQESYELNESSQEEKERFDKMLMARRFGKKLAEENPNMSAEELLEIYAKQTNRDVERQPVIIKAPECRREIISYKKLPGYIDENGMNQGKCYKRNENELSKKTRTILAIAGLVGGLILTNMVADGIGKNENKEEYTLPQTKIVETQQDKASEFRNSQKVEIPNQNFTYQIPNSKQYSDRSR